MGKCEDFLCKHNWNCIYSECDKCPFTKHFKTRCSVCIYVKICSLRGKGRIYSLDDNGNEYYIGTDGNRHYTRDEG